MSPTVTRAVNSIKKLSEHGYEVFVWTEDNYDINKSPRLRKAYSDKKWSLVSNYVRLDVLKAHGGVYVDTDIEIVRPFDDLLGLDYFIGFMWDSTLGTAVIGAIPNHPYVTGILDLYDADASSFISPNNNTFTEFFLEKVPGAGDWPGQDFR
jgi:mannosyltransferase OCH1-like enzyme